MPGTNLDGSEFLCKGEDEDTLESRQHINKSRDNISYGNHLNQVRMGQESGYNRDSFSVFGSGQEVEVTMNNTCLSKSCSRNSSLHNREMVQENDFLPLPKEIREKNDDSFKRSLRQDQNSHRGESNPGSHDTTLSHDSPVKRKYQDMNDNSRMATKRRIPPEQMAGKSSKSNPRHHNSDLSNAHKRYFKCKRYFLRGQKVRAGGGAAKSGTRPGVLASVGRLPPLSKSDESLNLPPTRLPGAFSIGQCRCLLCKKKIVNSLHCWLKCYLCGKVAHKKCAFKDSPGIAENRDLEEVYFLCSICVPV